MQNKAKYLCTLLVLLLSGVLLFSFTAGTRYVKKAFPYKKVGLTERQAAAHLLGRFTYGATLGQVDEVVKMGLENWLDQQLGANLSDAPLDQRLAAFPTLKMSNEQMVKAFPKGGQVLRMAIKDGVVNKDEVNKGDKEEYRKTLAAYMRKNDLQPQRELYKELISQKILRATYTQNQVQELMTSFWFNHFNVSLTDNDCSHFITAYERDAIRPNALGKFETMLLATAKSPAMLTYLDNFRSSAPMEAMTAEEKQRDQRRMQALRRRQAADTTMQQMQAVEKLRQARKAQGLNENYAREIMELHTLGVDGGYTQSDVTQAARIFTGWTIFPGLNGYGGDQKNPQAAKYLKQANFSQNGFVREGDFLFAGNRHDKGEKMVLGTKFPANGGYEEGQKLIHMLAHHPSTARFISTKIATRFVNDNPSKELIEEMARTFTKTDGDIKQVLLTMVSSKEFWGKEALREKTKSPFELAISSVRSLNAEVTDPTQLYNWINRMGEKMYSYQAPTGFPDKGQYWINTGSLLTRMNFGLALASQRIPGVKINLPALNQNREPESAEAALKVYSGYLMPERDLQETIKRLTPSLNDPDFSKKVDAAANKAVPAQAEEMMEDETTRMNVKGKERKQNPAKAKQGRKGQYAAMQPQGGKNQNMMLAQVVGIIIGSPEFQRR
ncbi:hypothetical protein TH63_11850 [Rufibacter radiotolerans]|uniref:DUF1800 domain-containing protein n=1 Tax=Rufibacter radiotolerans TaxID=1379910 RepID=A0A0H4VUZ8_9BACT|nr:DUF1800 domain-containing protein [Rufibacter radiotolerans]AKQ47669.1 hypothetical protein TH63_11850 [Rufibacter radiotolerans]